MPDTSATWVLSGFSIDPLNGLAITKTPIEFSVQKLLSISVNLPYSVRCNEVVTIPCSIVNYSTDQIEAEVIFTNENDEFEFVNVSDRIDAEKNTCKKFITVPSGDVVNVFFTVRPTKVGLIPLRVSAVSPVARDCVVKMLNVECEGITRIVNKAIFVDLCENTQIEPVEIAIEMPEIAVSDSTRVDVSCIGDLMGGNIKDLQSFVGRPGYNGETNMVTFMKNIAILNYMKHTNQLTLDIELNTKSLLVVGYQKHLTYQRNDGSFSALGQSDECGSTFLTAFVAKSLRRAAEHINIQEDIIDGVLKWLSEKQSTDGNFTENASIKCESVTSKSLNDVSMTAYVLSAFLLNKVNLK